MHHRLHKSLSFPLTTALGTSMHLPVRQRQQLDYEIIHIQKAGLGSAASSSLTGERRPLAKMKPEESRCIPTADEPESSTATEGRPVDEDGAAASRILALVVAWITNSLLVGELAAPIPSLFRAAWATVLVGIAILHVDSPRPTVLRCIRI
jgi:hypothetical protein